MWPKASLSIRIIVPLVVFQTASIFLCSTWLGRRMEKARLNDLRMRLDTEVDVVEGALSLSASGIRVDLTNPALEELVSESDFFAQVTDARGKLLFEGGGADAATRESLRERLPVQVESDSYSTLAMPTGSWLAQSERIERNGLPLFVHVATSADSALQDAARVKQSLWLGGLFLIALTVCGTGAVVSQSTRNFRRFARYVARATPPDFGGAQVLKPHSSEESLLFSGFDSMRKVVQEAHETQRMFIANASHELKSPVSAALAALEVTLAKGRDAHEYKQTCEDVLGELRTLQRLTFSLLDLERPPDSAASVCLLDSLRFTLSTVTQKWKGAAQARNISVEYAESGFISGAGARAPPVDAVRLTSVDAEIAFSNLIENAIKYSPQCGSVTVEMEGRGERVVVSIRDRGIGMSPQHMSKLGTLFFRADESRSDPNSFGLGFAQASRRIYAAQGSISVESVLGQGTTITVELPLSPA